ncbi:unnamed protein product, partial [Schistocephalus solidus]|uniref:Sec2p domain-containing protein n=1 Tax=Schistocephalus solidus TaxID=70667 RepID=A0A183T7Y1_SCHSO
LLILLLLLTTTSSPLQPPPPVPAPLTTPSGSLPRKDCFAFIARDAVPIWASNATTSSSISSSLRAVDVRQQQQQQPQDPSLQDASEFFDTDALHPPSHATEVLDAVEGAENVNTLLCEVLQSQLAQCNRQLSVYAGRAACACEEVRNLYEHLTATRDQLESQRLATEAAEQKSRALEEELESTKMRTAQQLSEMALHMAHLTDEINGLRLTTPAQATTRNKSSLTNGGGGGPRPQQPVAASASFRHQSPFQPRSDGLEQSISGSASNVQEKMVSYPRPPPVLHRLLRYCLTQDQQHCQTESH